MVISYNYDGYKLIMMVISYNDDESWLFICLIWINLVIPEQNHTVKQYNNDGLQLNMWEYWQKVILEKTEYGHVKKQLSKYDWRFMKILCSIISIIVFTSGRPNQLKYKRQRITVMLRHSVSGVLQVRKRCALCRTGSPSVVPSSNVQV